VLSIVVPLRVTVELLLLPRLSTEDPAVVVIVVVGWVLIEASTPAAGVHVCDTLYVPATSGPHAAWASVKDKALAMVTNKALRMK
jgi:hypothetical protein